MKTKLFLFICLAMLCPTVRAQELFPDGTPVDKWFSEGRPVEVATLGRRYKITDCGVKKDSTRVQTEALQAVIDRAAAEGGGVVVVPKGTYLTGPLFFRQGTHLHIEKGGKLKGSDDISDFPVVDTRIEGRSVKYFPAVINADSTDGFTITGAGTIDGNGLRYWKAFWLRRKWNPQCTNMDEMRPRLVYISNSKNVQIEGVTLRNSPFWTTHIYRCDHVRLLDVRLYAPYEPVKAPSSDALDIDVCHHVHVQGCYIHVNDDGIVLKGGKGPEADRDPRNGSNSEVLVEDCVYGFAHAALTCGSESIHCRNIILRNCRMERVSRVLWLKMRPDTPQRYEHILVEGITGKAGSFLYIQPWKQFFDLQGHKEIPMSYGDNVTMRRCDMECDRYFNVSERRDQYRLSNFRFEDLKIKARDPQFHPEYIEGECKVERVEVEAAQ